MNDALTSDALHLDVHRDVGAMIEEVVDIIKDNGGVGTVDAVSWQGFDGFVPFTDGGWDGVVAFDLHHEVTHTMIHPSIVRLIDAGHRLAEDEFRGEYGVPDSFTDVEDHDEWEDWRDAWEMSCPEHWFVKVRALYYRADSHRNETGHDEYLICFGICDDVDYGRDSISWLPGVGTHWLWEETVLVADLTEEKLESIKGSLLETWEQS